MLGYTKNHLSTKSLQALVNLPGSMCRPVPSWHFSSLPLGASTTGKASSRNGEVKDLAGFCA